MKAKLKLRHARMVQRPKRRESWEGQQRRLYQEVFDQNVVLAVAGVNRQAAAHNLTAPETVRWLRAVSQAVADLAARCEAKRG